MRPPGGFTFKKQGNPWFSWHYITSHGHDIAVATEQHVTLTLLSVGLGILASIPLSYFARRTPWLRTLILALCNGIYAIPSLAFIIALYKFFGLGKLTVVIPLASYTLVILVRSILAGLDGVSQEVVDAAKGMGFSDARTMLRVRLPIAVPTLIAGLRIATVSTIELVVIGGYVAQGGYGARIFEGYNSNLYKPEITTYILLTVLLALAADFLLLGVQRAITPWQRRRAAS
jgi:osmoprotectant transport system permease protein